MSLPAVLPTLNLNFAKSRKLDSRISFTRASTATYVGADGLVKTAATNEARFDHHPTTRESLGLLIEGSRQNLLLWSEDFSNAAWIKTASSITVNAATAPDGTVTADKFIDSSAASDHSLAQNLTVTAGQNYAFSIWVKAAEYSKVALTLGGSGQGPQEYILADLSSGTLSSGGPPVYTSIDAYPNGWYRIAIVATSESTSLSFWLRVANAAGATTFAGTGSSGVYVWGAQAEIVSKTSYIKTTSSAATRSSDIALISGANFSSGWYNASEGTIYASFISSPQLESATRRAVVLTDAAGAYANAIVAGNIGNLRQFVYSGGVLQADQNVAISAGLRNAMALAYKDNYFAVTGNGLTPVSDTLGTVPSVALLSLGGDGLGSTAQQLNGTIERLAYLPKAISTSELQSITAY